MPRTKTADVSPDVTYEWIDSEQTILRRTNADGTQTFVPADPNNRSYAAYLASNEEAKPYVEPEPPKPLSTAEKVDNMLQAFGLTREEMQEALAVKTTKAKK